jgi:PAS domain S-box-containing protein
VKVKMEQLMEQFSANDSNPMLSVDISGIVLYSNESGEPLLQEWGMEIGEKLPSSIVDLVRKAIFRNSPEKMEVNVGKEVYLIVLHPLPKQECVNIFGFDISYQKELEDKFRKSENKYRNIVETYIEGIWIFNEVSETTYVNKKMTEMLGYNREEMIGKFIWDFVYEEDKDIFQVKLASRKQGVDAAYELKLLRKDDSPLLVSVSVKELFDDTGKFEGSVGMFTDITKSKQAEEEIQVTKNMLQQIMNNIPQDT